MSALLTDCPPFVMDIEFLEPAGFSCTSEDGLIVDNIIVNKIGINVENIDMGESFLINSTIIPLNNIINPDGSTSQSLDINNDRILEVEAITNPDGTNQKIVFDADGDGTPELSIIYSPTLRGGANNDFIRGNDLDNRLFGGKDRDTLKGGSGNDFLGGNKDNDELFGEEGNDTLNAGQGNDSLEGGTGRDKLSGVKGDDELFGQEGNDALRGGEGNDTLNGGTGNDFLIGGTGNDELNGDEGDDTLRGGQGTDTFTGGTGNDTFKYIAADLDDSTDTITDFTVGEDKIRIKGLTSSDTVSYDSTTGNVLVNGDVIATIDSGLDVDSQFRGFNEVWEIL